MKFIRSISILALAAGAMFITGCANNPMQPYHVTAYKPHDPSRVSVKVSLSKQNVYVMEGNRCLMAVACTVGKPDHPTPTGNFHIEAKIPNKRSGSYGFTSSGGPAELDKGQNVAVGYPMAFWCEFAPAFGFHQGFVWTVPHTHGCIRMHKLAAPRFYELVRIGTPVNIARTQPEDETLGKSVQRIDQSGDPDPATSFLMSPRVFEKPPGPLLVDQPQ
ncbi:MAG: L,D-transpeptidase [Chthoniobacteraceae bacterium]